MKVHSMKLAIVAAALALAACAGTNFKWEDAAKVHDGMSEAEVTAILGPPYSRVQTADFTLLTWSFAAAFGGAKAVSYRLVNDKVVTRSTVNSR